MAIAMGEIPSSTKTFTLASQYIDKNKDIEEDMLFTCMHNDKTMDIYIMGESDAWELRCATP